MYVFVLIVLLHYNVEYIAAYTRCLYSSSSLDVKSRWTLFGKENKKKKKSKKSEGITSSSSSSSPIATPMRVDTNINIPVRQQIAWAKAYKRMQTDVK